MAWAYKICFDLFLVEPWSLTQGDILSNVLTLMAKAPDEVTDPFAKQLQQLLCQGHLGEQRKVN